MSLPDQLLTAPVKDLPMIANAVFGFVGVVLGLLAGAFATIYSQNRQSKREKFKELRSNLFAAVLEASKIQAWAEKEGVYYAICSEQGFVASATQDSATQVDPYPTEKIRAIISLYFPKFRDHARVLAAAALNHHLAAVKLAKVRHGKNSEDAVDKQRDEMQTAFEVLFQNQMQFEEIAQELMAIFLDEKSKEGKTSRFLNKLRRN